MGLRRHSGTLGHLALAFSASLAIHAGLVGLLSWQRPTRTPSVLVEFDIADDAQLVGIGQAPDAPEAPMPPKEQPPPVETPPPPPPPDVPARAIAVKIPSKKDVANKQTPRPSPPPAPRLPEEPTTVRPAHGRAVPFIERRIPAIRSVAPGNAVITAVIDTTKVRRSPYRDELVTLFESFPDYDRVIGRSGIDPIATYDKLLITSANPRYLSETMLLASTRAPSAVLRANLGRVVEGDLAWSERKGLTVGAPATWWTRRGDPRIFVLPAEGILAFAKPELIPFLKARAQKVAREGGSFFPTMPTAIDPNGAGLPAVLVVEASQLKVQMVGLARGLPAPVAIQLAAHDDEEPLIRARLTFATPAEAEGFMRAWPKLQRKLIGMWQVALMGYTAIIKRVQTERSGHNAVYIEVRAKPTEVRSVLRLAARMIKNNTRHLGPQPGDLPPRPDAGTPTSSDAGADTAPARPEIPTPRRRSPPLQMP